jgi:hypothetical protein
MGSDCVDVTLTPHWTVAEPPAGVHDNPEKQHASLQLWQIFYAADIHGNGINRIWSGAVGIPQAATDSIKRTVFRSWPEHSISVTEIQGVFENIYFETGIKFRLRRRRSGGP